MLNAPLNIEFRRAFKGKWIRWVYLVERLMDVNLSTQPDVFVHALTTSGLFMVKSLYLDLMNSHTRFLRKYIWKLKIPLK